MFKSGYKVVLLGEPNVGKTSILHRLRKKEFNEYSESTIGASFYCHHEYISNNSESNKVQNKFQSEKVKLDIWDTAGGERYNSLAPLYYRGAHFAIVVYDQNRSSSLDSAIEWVKKIKHDVTKCVYLVGNKSDLKCNIDQSKIKTILEQMDGKLKSICVSAKTGENISQLFQKIALDTKGYKLLVDKDTIDIERQSVQSCCVLL